MRAVFDTNVVISSLVFGRRLAWLRTAWAAGTVVPVICRETAIELIRVLAYPKFRLTEPDRAALLADYLPYAEVVLLPNRLPVLPVACRDRDDVVFLQLALAAGVPIVSGDGDLSVLRDIAPVPVISVAELHDRVR